MAYRDRNSQPTLRVEVTGQTARVISQRATPVPDHDGEIEPVGSGRAVIHTRIDQIRVNGRLLGPMSRKVVDLGSSVQFGGKSVAISSAGER